MVDVTELRSELADDSVNQSPDARAPEVTRPALIRNAVNRRDLNAVDDRPVLSRRAVVGEGSGEHRHLMPTIRLLPQEARDVTLDAPLQLGTKQVTDVQDPHAEASLPDRIRTR